MSGMGELVSFDSDGGSTDGYLALPPANSAPWTPVIVIQEWWGLVAHVKSVADRIAAEGFVALAPDLYHGTSTAEPDEARRLLMGLEMDQAGKDIAGAAAYRAAWEDCADRVGVVRFCVGGRLALWSATLAFYPAIPCQRITLESPNYQGRYAAIHCSEAHGTSAAPGIQQARTAI